MASLPFALSKRNLLLAGLAVIVLIVALTWGGEEDTAATAKAVVSKGDIEEVVTAQGTLEPKVYVDLGAQVSGIIEKLNVEIGDDVKAGDLIAEIDPKVYRSQVESDQAQLKTLKAQRLEQEANVQLAKMILERNRKLIAVDAVSRETLEEAEAAEKIARAKLQSLDAQIEQANSVLEGNLANLEYTKIYSSIDGTVVDQMVQEGETLNARQTTPTIVQIANLDLMTVRAQVAEADITKLREGMEVYFTTLGSNNRRWTGTVRQILPTPETVNDVVLYNVLMDIENKDRQLMTDMSTQMFFVLGRAVDVPLIPASALVKRAPEQDSEAGQAYHLQVEKDGKAEERTVIIGLSDRNHAQVISGVSEGETIVLPSPASATNARTRTPRL